MAGDWLPGGLIGGLFATLAILVWRIVRLGVGQEQRLLKPAWDRIDRLEKRIAELEKRQRDCESDRAHYLFLLQSHGIDPGRRV